MYKQASGVDPMQTLRISQAICPVIIMGLASICFLCVPIVVSASVLFGHNNNIITNNENFVHLCVQINCSYKLEIDSYCLFYTIIGEAHSGYCHALLSWQ